MSQPLALNTAVSSVTRAIVPEPPVNSTPVFGISTAVEAVIVNGVSLIF